MFTDELSDYSLEESKKRKREPVSEDETLASESELDPSTDSDQKKSDNDPHKAKKQVFVESPASTQTKKRNVKGKSKNL